MASPRARPNGVIFYKKIDRGGLSRKWCSWDGLLHIVGGIWAWRDTRWVLKSIEIATGAARSIYDCMVSLDTTFATEIDIVSSWLNECLDRLETLIAVVKYAVYLVGVALLTIHDTNYPLILKTASDMIRWMTFFLLNVQKTQY